MLKIINSKKCYGNDTNPELGKSDINNIKCDKKCKLDHAGVCSTCKFARVVPFD